jgi:hypothetical protein
LPPFGETIQSFEPAKQKGDGDDAIGIVPMLFSELDPCFIAPAPYADLQ